MLQNMSMSIHQTLATPQSSHRDVSYSCGSCGYALNLSSSTRITSSIGCKYDKMMRKGIMPFYSVDDSRFLQTDQFTCLPYFHSKSSWGLFRHTTKLCCRKCKNYIGVAYDDYDEFGGRHACNSSSSLGLDMGRKKYMIRISALQPSFDESATPLCL